MKKITITEENYNKLKNRVVQSYLSANDIMRTNSINARKIMAGKKIIPTRIYLGIKGLPDNKCAYYYLSIKKETVENILKNEKEAVIGKSFNVIEKIRKNTMKFSR